jgi:hypothetical protein
MTGASYAWNTPACYGPPAAPLGAPRRATAEASVRRLLAHGGDPNLRDTRQHCTPLEEAQMGDSPGHREVEAILQPLTQDPPHPSSS